MLGAEVTAIDPKIDSKKNHSTLSEPFTQDTDLEPYDLIFCMNPRNLIGNVISKCALENKPLFCIPSPIIENNKYITTEKMGELVGHIPGITIGTIYADNNALKRNLDPLTFITFDNREKQQSSDTRATFPEEGTR
ncbi:MAG: hypothetical protein FWC68_04450 [Oscillospiraceae bacterium]|nr:hypothetical protein [Oscillospiraceae bacterium]